MSSLAASPGKTDPCGQPSTTKKRSADCRLHAPAFRRSYPMVPHMEFFMVYQRFTKLGVPCKRPATSKNCFSIKYSFRFAEWAKQYTHCPTENSCVPLMKVHYLLMTPLNKTIEIYVLILSRKVKKVQGSWFKVQGSFISHYSYKVNMERKVRLKHMITR